MYDSLTTLIQMLDNSDRSTCIFISQIGEVKISIGRNDFIYQYSPQGISQAIKELENLL